MEIQLNPTDWPQGSRAIVTVPENPGLIEVMVLEWADSGNYVRVQIFDGMIETRLWRTSETEWELVERLKGSFGQ